MPTKKRTYLYILDSSYCVLLWLPRLVQHDCMDRQQLSSPACSSLVCEQHKLLQPSCVKDQLADHHTVAEPVSCDVCHWRLRRLHHAWRNAGMPKC